MKTTLTKPVLEDVLAPGLKVVFCGTGAGNRSAALGRYYAGRGNKFWRVLHEARFTTRQLEPSEYRTVLDFGLGLTDLAKYSHGMDKDLDVGDLDHDGLRARILAVAPDIVAFTSITTAKVFLGRHPGGYGPLTERVGVTRLWVLPSTSGAANSSWDIEPWRDLRAEALGEPLQQVGAALAGQPGRARLAPAPHSAAQRLHEGSRRVQPAPEPSTGLPAVLQLVREVATMDPVVRTLSRGNRWEIVDVDSRGVLVRGGTGNATKRIEATLLAAAWDRLQAQGQLARVEVQRELGRTNYRRSALLFALLARLPGVRLAERARGKVLEAGVR